MDLHQRLLRACTKHWRSVTVHDALHRSQQLPCKPNSESDLFRVAHSELLRGTLTSEATRISKVQRRLQGTQGDTQRASQGDSQGELQGRRPFWGALRGQSGGFLGVAGHATE